MISDAELTALYGNGLRPDTAARLIDDLRAARAERDALASRAVRIFERSAEPDPLLDEIRILRARLAEVEAERDRERRWKWEERDRAEAAEADARDLVWYKASVRELEARLAAVRDLCDRDNPYLGHQECLLKAEVRALCDEEAVWNGPPHATNSEVRWFANDIRAVIDQEADRGN